LPWSVLPLAPTLLLPSTGGQAFMMAFALFSIGAWVIVLASPTGRALPVWIITLSLATPHTLDLILRGNFEGFLAFGLALAWWGYKTDRPLVAGVGIVFFTMKPINMVLPGVFFLVAGLRWGWRRFAWLVLPMLVTLALSVVMSGWDWPLRYFATSFSSDEVYSTLSIQNPALYLQAALWRFFEEALGVSPNWGLVVSGVGYLLTIGYILWERETTAHKLAVTVTASLFFAVYVHGNHYVLAAPALALVLLKSPRYVWIYALTFTPFLRLWWGWHHVWVDSLYILALLVVLVWLYVVQPRRVVMPESVA
jgi:hypothetical protein